MKVKSLAMGMVLPLAASVAVSTAPAASAAAPTKVEFTQSAVTTAPVAKERNKGRDHKNGYWWCYNHKWKHGWHKHHNRWQWHKHDYCKWKKYHKW